MRIVNGLPSFIVEGRDGLWYVIVGSECYEPGKFSFASAFKSQVVMERASAISAAYEKAAIAPDCPRTRALWKPGEKIEGVKHRYAWNGSMPCTGRLVCSLCGGTL